MQQTMDGNRFVPEARQFPVDIPADRTTVRLYFFFLCVLAALGLPPLFETGKLSGQLVGTYSLQWVVLLSITVTLGAAQLAVLILLHTTVAPGLLRFGQSLVSRLDRYRAWNLLGFTIPWLAFVLVVLYRYEKHFASFLPRVWLFWAVTALGAVFLLAFYRKLSYFWAVLATAVLYGAGVKALGYLPEISAYPFSLSWSEASRYYYASLPFANRLYGMDIPLSFLHPSRYLLQSLAFLIPVPSIWLHRFWQVALWLTLPLLTGWILARRLRLRREAAFVAAVWALLILLQGPVYYHLLVCVILVLWGFDRNKFWKSLVIVALASAWAGISRVNWFPVPAFLAVTLYLLERPVCEARRWSDYLAWPAAWGITGGVSALLAQAAYVVVSGHEDPSAFGSSFTSALLWYRLLPSPTYPMGVLPAILLISLPLLVLVGGNWLRSKADWHALRLLGIGAMAFVLFTGGLVVSTKIGGGSNIHNLDAFIVLLLVVGLSIWLGRFASERGAAPGIWQPWLLAFALVAVPVVWNLDIGDPFVRRDFEQSDYDLAKLAAIVEKHAPEGEVLFITQRQLVVFDMIPGVRMVPDYELLTLTEMSISNNRAYLEKFYEDLASHRFALIVANRQSEWIKNPLVDSFAEENNAWAIHVAPYLREYYQSELFFETQGIDMLVPRTQGKP